MAEQAGESKKKGFFGHFKVVLGGFLGLCTGAFAMYFNAVFDMVVKPAKPVANFAVSADGLTVTCQNRASGQSGFWDFGDGTELEPFDPNVPAVEHKYVKPGNYAVVLKVRNFLLEDDERKVTVDLSKPPETLPPTIANLKVEAIGQQVAPATFRISGQIQNAERVVWALGDKTEVVTDTSGPFERLVVFEQPKTYDIRLVALTGKQAVMQGSTVTVAAPTDGSLVAMLKVTDSGTKTDRNSIAEWITAPVQTKAGPTKGFEKVISARPSFVIADVQFDAKRLDKMVKNLKAEVSPDRRTAKISGEWAAAADVVSKMGGGSDIRIPLTVINERTLPGQPMTQRVSGVYDPASRQIVLTLPPAPSAVAGAARQMEIELAEVHTNGRRDVLAQGTIPASGTWSGPVNYRGSSVVAQATTANGKVQVQFVQPTTSPVKPRP